MDLCSEVLLQCITQKICHDLASPIGTLMLGLESLDKSEMTDLLQESLSNATSRLSLFRCFFSKSSALSTKEYTSHLKTFLKNKKINLELIGEAYNDEARILLGFCLIAVDILSRGGMITLDCGIKSITCSGHTLQKICFDSYLEDILNPQYKNGIIYYYILSLCLKNSQSVQVDYFPSAATLQLMPKNH